jgi:hypothetical protein
MTREAQPFDVSQNPELLSFAREIKRSGTPRLLSADGEELVRVSPIRATRRSLKGKRTSADDPVWHIIGMGRSVGGPSNVSEHVDEFLAEWEVSQNRP